VEWASYLIVSKKGLVQSFWSNAFYQVCHAETVISDDESSSSEDFTIMACLHGASIFLIKA
jgi:hypothetical protein